MESVVVVLHPVRHESGQNQRRLDSEHGAGLTDDMGRHDGIGSEPARAIE